VYKEYLIHSYKTLFFLENQEGYGEYLDHIAGQSTENPDGLGDQPVGRFGLALTSEWSQFFGTKKLQLEHALSLSLFPIWQVEKESKTETLGFRAYDPKNEDSFRSLVKDFLKKYAPKKLFVPPYQACLRVGNRKYNDGGEVRHDYESPKNSWNSSFKLQSFMTGPLTLREVWLPGRVTKMSNSFWFSILDQIIRNVPYYANNFSTAEELWENIKTKLHGNAVLFDVSGFGIQFPRSLLDILCDEIEELYHSSPELSGRVKELHTILKEVWVEKEDGTFLKPPRGIGLGYYESMKTLCVLAILDHTNPISVFGDQGLVPFSIKKRKDHPRELLKAHGFLFEKITKARILTDINTGVLWAGAHMTPSSFRMKKSWTPSFAGASGGMYHWERKLAFRSMILPKECNHFWKYLAFQYELAFGYEFFAGESYNNFLDLGLSPDGIRERGNTRYTAVNQLVPPKANFTSSMVRSVFPTREVTIPRRICKAFSIKRQKAFRSNRIINDYQYEYSNPRIEMNNKIKPNLDAVARATPFWMAARQLILNNVDSGKIPCGLKDDWDLRQSISKFPLAENPFEARATGGYTVQSVYKGNFGTTTEHFELYQCLRDSIQAGEGHFVYRKDSVLPASSQWDDWNPRLPLEHPVFKRKSINPYLAKSLSETLIGTSFPDTDLSSELSELAKRIKAQVLELDTVQANVSEDWELPQHEDFVEVEEGSLADELGEFYDYLEPDDALDYAPHSRGVSPVDEAFEWNL